MLTEVVNFEDFDGNPQTTKLYFNLTKVELTENLSLNDRVQTIKTMVEGESRYMTSDELTQILDLVKEVMRLSYGIKSADGLRFQKSPEIWNDFQQTAVYDQFLFSLFENPDKANNFLLGVFPKDIVAQAKSQIQADAVPQPRLVSVSEPAVAPPVESASTAVSDDIPAYQKENREPTSKELQAMDKDEILAAMMWKQNRS